MTIPSIWKSNMGWRHRERLARESQTTAAAHITPLSRNAWEARRSQLRRFLTERFLLERDAAPLDLQVHGSIPRQGYRIDRVSYSSQTPNIRITAALYVPDGKGPFPAVVNLHGHWAQGHLAARVQERGHLLASHGFTVLSPDAPGSGERSAGEGEHRYHGSLAGAGLYLFGDSLLGWQARDNRRAVDVLRGLPFVDADNIGVTGASGGGNQSMWLAACDDRIKTSVPVVSVGTFAAYVTERNCICETLPGGLPQLEEWEALALMAPRPMLILNAYKDCSPSFGPDAVTRTAEAVRDLYALFDACANFDLRIINKPHGYWHEMLSAMLGWMNFHLKGIGSALPMGLPALAPETETAIRSFAPGTWPKDLCAFASNRKTLLNAAITGRAANNACAEERRKELARLTGFKQIQQDPVAHEAEPGKQGAFTQVVLVSPRMLPLPLVMRAPDSNPKRVDLIIGSQGKAEGFAARALDEAGAAIAMDLPGIGELAWESPEPIAGGTLHDTSRACLWLGYTLAGEWAECVAVLARWARRRFKGCELRLRADSEAALAVLISAALDAEARACSRDLIDLPRSFVDVFHATTGSLAMIVPDILLWGDIADIQRLADDNNKD